MLYEYQIWSKEPLIQAKDDGDLNRGQMSLEVKCGKLYAMTTTFGLKNQWPKEPLLIAFTEVKKVNRAGETDKQCMHGIWLLSLVRRTTDTV